MYKIWYANNLKTEENSSVSFLNFLSTTLERPIYKASRTLARQIEIFLYGDEYRKSSQVEEVHQAYFIHSSYG